MKTVAPARLAALVAAALLFPGCALVEDTRQRAEKEKVVKLNKAMPISARSPAGASRPTATRNS